MFRVLREYFRLLVSNSLSERYHNLLYHVNTAFAPICCLNSNKFPVFSYVFVAIQAILCIKTPLLIVFYQ